MFFRVSGISKNVLFKLFTAFYVLKLNLFATEAANNFTNVYVFIW